jgi:hypothetical protein
VTQTQQNTSGIDSSKQEVQLATETFSRHFPWNFQTHPFSSHSGTLEFEFQYNIMKSHTSNRLHFKPEKTFED